MAAAHLSPAIQNFFSLRRLRNLENMWLKYCLTGIVTVLWIVGSKAQPSVAYDSARNELKKVIAQLTPDQEWTVGTIVLQGNSITKKYIIYREIPFTTGSSMSTGSILSRLEEARLNLLNTQLFLEVLPSIVSWDNRTIDFLFVVKERWYIFPVPYFKLIDRNPNQWLIEQNASLERVNYGLKFNWENVSGRRDKLRFNYVNGYSRQFILYYEQPYADPTLQHGFLAGAFYSQTRQMAYATDSNKQVFYPAANNTIDGFVNTSLRIEAGYSFRKGVNHRHSVRLAWVSEKIPDTINTIIENNYNKGYLPYFSDGRSTQNFAELYYSYQYYNVNNIPYPWKGFAFSGDFTQRGLGLKGMNLWQAKAKAGQYLELNKKTSLSLMGMAIIKLPFRQPMYNLQALGYGDFYLRGLEYYVIDGVMAGIFKATLRRELLEVRVPTFFIKNEKYKKIPFKIVAKIYGDAGGVHLPHFTNSVLSNKLIYTYGAGMDLLSYYDFVARFEYSFNQLGQKGLFLHLRRDF
jgi:outer membrane protein assembly factor BamA